MATENTYAVERSTGVVTPGASAILVVNDIIPVSVTFADSAVDVTAALLSRASLSVAIRLGALANPILVQAAQSAVVSGVAKLLLRLDPEQQDAIYRAASTSAWVEIVVSERSGPRQVYTYNGTIELSSGSPGGGVEASLAEVDAGTVGGKYVSPEKLGVVTAPGRALLGAASVAAQVAALGLPPSAGKAIQLRVTLASHGFAAKDVLRHNGTTWVKGQANSLAGATVQGVVEQNIDANTFLLNLGGQFTASGMSAGIYYLSDATAGLLTQTSPTATTSFQVSVLRAISATEAYVEISDPLPLTLIPHSAIAKLATVTYSASATLAATDMGKRVAMDNASANNLTVPPNASVAIENGDGCLVEQIGAGLTTIVAGSGVTINSRGGALKMGGQFAQASLIKTATDVWTLSGDIST